MTLTHTHALLADVTQLAHIPVLPHLSQHLWLSACLRGLTNTWRAKQSNLRPTRRLMFRSAVAAPCIRGAESIMHQCIRDFTQAAPVCILISSPPHAVLLHVYCMSAGIHAFDIRTEVTRLTQTLWSHHRWQMGRQGWGGAVEATLCFLPVRSVATNNNNSTVWVSLLHDSVMLSLFILFTWPTTCAFTNWLMGVC